MTSWRGMYSLLNYPIYISYFIYHSFHWSSIRSYFSDDFIFVTACVHVYFFVRNRERLWDNFKITLLATIQQNISWWSIFFRASVMSNSQFPPPKYCTTFKHKFYNSRHIVCINLHSYSFHRCFSELNLNSYFNHVSLFRDVRRHHLLKSILKKTTCL